jgi:4-hydroxybenzoate polyprenyltransferase
MDFKKFSQLIMIEQTLFALPFAFIGVLFAGGKELSTWFWVAIALVAARTAGMSFNRVIDAAIDAKNPRTQNRLLPKGEVDAGMVWLIAMVSSLVLIFSSLMLNRLCFYLSFAAVAMLFTYSYFKRFSASSHFYLGAVEAAAPIGGYLAVTGELTIIPFILGMVILMWIAGLDIIYAVQDREFDIREKLHSIPARMGEKRAITISLACYGVAMIALTTAGILTHKTLPYWVAVFCTGSIFAYQQKIVRQGIVADTIKKFFQVNLYVSPILFIGTFMDLFLK